MSNNDKKELKTIEEPNAITKLMQTAVEKLDSESASGVVAVIERLVDLKLKVDAETAKKDFFSALNRFQEQCPSINRSSTAKVATSGGSSYSYKYAELDEIVRTIKPLIFKNGFSFTWDSETTDSKIKCTCHLRHEKGHETTSSFESPVPNKLGAQNIIQISASVLTYIKRQTLVEILGLTMTDQDTDGIPPESLETISAGQADELEQLADEIGVDKPKFLAYMDVQDFADISKADHKRAINALEKKRK